MVATAQKKIWQGGVSFHFHRPTDSILLWGNEWIVIYTSLIWFGQDSIKVWFFIESRTSPFLSVQSQYDNSLPCMSHNCCELLSSLPVSTMPLFCILLSLTQDQSRLSARLGPPTINNTLNNFQLFSELKIRTCLICCFTGDWMYLVDYLINVALNRPTFQVTTLLSLGPSYAVDGLLNNMACTTSLTQPWWAVDIGDPVVVVAVEVFYATASTGTARNSLLNADFPWNLRNSKGNVSHVSRKANDSYNLRCLCVSTHIP